MHVITLLYWAVLLSGLSLSGTFLVLHRPKNWFRARAFNATGWVIIIFILFMRAILVVALKQNYNPHFESTEEMVVSLGLGAFADVLLFIRLRSFLAFRKDPVGYLRAARIAEDAEHS